MRRPDIAAVLATFRFASAELGSEEAGMIADRLPVVKGAPVVWPKAATGSR